MATAKAMCLIGSRQMCKAKTKPVIYEEFERANTLANALTDIDKDGWVYEADDNNKGEGYIITVYAANGEFIDFWGD